MSLKIVLLLTLIISFSGLVAQDTAATTGRDSFTTVIKMTDGKIVTVGEPVSLKPLSTTDEVKIFCSAVYEKYPLWCWIAGIFLLLTVFGAIKKRIN